MWRSTDLKSEQRNIKYDPTGLERASWNLQSVSAIQAHQSVPWFVNINSQTEQSLSSADSKDSKLFGLRNQSQTEL